MALLSNITANPRMIFLAWCFGLLVVCFAFQVCLYYNIGMYAYLCSTLVLVRINWEKRAQHIPIYFMTKVRDSFTKFISHKTTTSTSIERVERGIFFPVLTFCPGFKPGVIRDFRTAPPPSPALFDGPQARQSYFAIHGANAS